MNQVSDEVFELWQSEVVNAFETVNACSAPFWYKKNADNNVVKLPKCMTLEKYLEHNMNMNKEINHKCQKLRDENTALRQELKGVKEDMKGFKEDMKEIKSLLIIKDLRLTTLQREQSNKKRCVISSSHLFNIMITLIHIN